MLVGVGAFGGIFSTSGSACIVVSITSWRDCSGVNGWLKLAGMLGRRAGRFDGSSGGC